MMSQPWVSSFASHVPRGGVAREESPTSNAPGTTRDVGDTDTGLQRPRLGVACRLQSTASMSVKSLLPILGVGSAFAILGLAASRRRSSGSLPASPPVAPGDERRQSSGVHPRVMLDENDAASAAPLTSEFWDAAPESYSLAEESIRTAPGTFEAYDAVDTEDLSAEWLTRATEAPSLNEQTGGDADDPAEIAADSLSMISDASRHAAVYAYEDEDGDDSGDDELSRR